MMRGSWQGTLLEEKRDMSGSLFRRGRYVDPASGRFTQEDPIGLAGGMNLYGFANSDPVNFSDPLGLLPMDIIVQGENAQLTVDFLREHSASFKKLYDALDADHSVHLAISEQSMDGVINAFHPPGDVDKTWGVIAFSTKSLNQANYELIRRGEKSWMYTAASVMSHEFAHAGGYYGKLNSSCAGRHPGSSACSLGFENLIRGELPLVARGGIRTYY
jgi:RHS repeat-associated protein